MVFYMHASKLNRYFSKLALSQLFLEGEPFPWELSHGGIGASKQIHVGCFDRGAAI